jgi:hypothetical protein
MEWPEDKAIKSLKKRKWLIKAEGRREKNRGDGSCTRDFLWDEENDLTLLCGDECTSLYTLKTIEFCI